MTLLEAISPTARALLNRPKSGGGMNITKNTKRGNFRIHLAVAKPGGKIAPQCGGGNAARSAQWQEVILDCDCLRCRNILATKERKEHERKEANAYSR